MYTRPPCRRPHRVYNIIYYIHWRSSLVTVSRTFFFISSVCFVFARDLQLGSSLLIAGRIPYYYIRRVPTTTLCIYTFCLFFFSLLLFSLFPFFPRPVASSIQYLIYLRVVGICCIFSIDPPHTHTHTHRRESNGKIRRRPAVFRVIELTAASPRKFQLTNNPIRS